MKNHTIFLIYGKLDKALMFNTHELSFFLYIFDVNFFIRVKIAE